MNEADLKAIRELIREELGPIKADISGMQTDISGMQTDISGLKADVDSMKTNINGIKADADGMKADISGLKAEVLKTNMRIENEIIPQLHLLAEGHNMLAQTLAPKTRVDKLEEKMQTLEFAVKMVNAEVQQLKKAQ